MEGGTLLFEDGEFAIRRYETIPEEAVQFLDSILWGTEGAVYEHRATAYHLRGLKDPVLLAMLREGRLVGTAIFCRSTVRSGGREALSYYTRYYAASPEIRGKGIMKEYARRTMQVLWEAERGKAVFFNSIEGGNHASWKTVSSAGYHEIGKVHTMGFSRFFPRHQSGLQRIVDDEGRAEVKGLLESLYSGHALVHFDSLFRNDDYYVIRDAHGIVAGCQYHRAMWTLRNMPGPDGLFIMHVLPHIPLLNRLFNPKRFEFLAFEGIWVRPGCEATLMQLFEGLLAREGLYSALFWMGAGCPVRERLLRHGSLGPMQTFVASNDVKIMAHFNQFPPEEEQDVVRRPMYASAYDYI